MCVGYVLENSENHYIISYVRKSDYGYVKKQLVDVMDEEVRFPLPPKTAPLRYAMSAGSLSCVTRSNKEEVLLFYKDIMIDSVGTTKYGHTRIRVEVNKIIIQIVIYEEEGGVLYFLVSTHDELEE